MKDKHLTISKDYSREEFGREKKQVCEVLDLLMTVSPGPTAANRVLLVHHLEEHTQPHSLSALIDLLAWDCCSWFELDKNFEGSYRDLSVECLKKARRMEVKRKQEDYQSKLSRDMHNFHMVVVMDSMLMVNATMDMEMETSLLEDVLELEKSIIKPKRCGEEQLSIPPQGVTKVETLKPSMIEEFPTVNELPQAQEVVEESIVHVEEEALKEKLCDFMSGKNNEKEEYIEIKEKERVEERERLEERLCIFDSISIFSK
ncbi:hypothetical protein M9H77_16762 [Catharanthus roseus]|uniref:Uncharacterized protein n=1 Tax=Catharanthus roseus TaxID=4058 RepID=A0ACC0B2N9_CATRO|nr:hypothetical protein M9H77_16762 [Catharanthus roseus]